MSIFKLHSDYVPTGDQPQAIEKLTEGLVITIEPFLTTGRGQILTARDNWTLKTADKMPVAQYEHTIVINGSCPIIVTAP